MGPFSHVEGMAGSNPSPDRPRPVSVVPSEHVVGPAITVEVTDEHIGIGGRSENARPARARDPCPVTVEAAARGEEDQYLADGGADAGVFPGPHEVLIAIAVEVPREHVGLRGLGECGAPARARIPPRE